MPTPIKTTVELLTQLKELLPHNTLFGRTDDLPKEFKEGFIVQLGDVSLNEERSGLCCDSYERLVYIDYRAQLHRDDWLIRAAEQQEELLALLSTLDSRFRFRTFDEPQTESAEFEYVSTRSTWVYNYEH